jgi:hypothetical protein
MSTAITRARNVVMTVVWYVLIGAAFYLVAVMRDESGGERTWIHSYWPTTVRVDSDMDSFWLNNEERTCQTHPDDNGRVAVVACNTSGSHPDHNIPVKFWGGVDRNTVSDWKCRREGEGFVCRALD